MLDAALLVGGLALLTFAADRFVLAAARLSAALRISPVVIGAVVIGFGTSTPEFLVTILATLRGSQDLAFGNIVGSNTANVLLVLGAAGLFSPVFIRVQTLRREVPLMLAAVTLLGLTTFDLRVTTVDAVVLLAAAVGALGVVLWWGYRDREAAAILALELAEYERGMPPRPGRDVLVTLAGLVGTLAGAQLLVEGAVGFARAIGVSEAVIGLTVVAVGTSLPELVTAVAASRRGEPDLVVGNVLGSNLFNALPVAGVAGLLDTVELDPAFRIGTLVMVLACLVAALFLTTGRRLGRREGAALLAGFVAAVYVTV
jgi:cation:H+ antiporter